MLFADDIILVDETKKGLMLNETTETIVESQGSN